ncbi:essential protein Yae1, partial [Aspergillus sp. HF37]
GGFDAGFPVGAQLGMRAGTVLGILEGLVRGFEGDAAAGVVKKRRPQQVQRRDGGDHDSGNDGNGDGGEGRREKKERILKTYRAAVKELQVEAVFAGLDGEALSGQGQGQGHDQEKKKPQGELARKGDAAIAGWEGRVSVARWEENMDALETRDKDGHGDVGSDGKQGQGQGQGPELAASS